MHFTLRRLFGSEGAPAVNVFIELEVVSTRGGLWERGVRSEESGVSRQDTLAAANLLFREGHLVTRREMAVMTVHGSLLTLHSRT